MAWGYAETSDLDMRALASSWVHLALVKDNGDGISGMNVYVNGTAISVHVGVPETRSITESNTRTLVLGKEYVSSVSSMFTKNMILDELIVCDSPVSAGEVRSLISLWEGLVFSVFSEIMWNNKTKWDFCCVFQCLPLDTCQSHLTQHLQRDVVLLRSTPPPSSLQPLISPFCWGHTWIPLAIVVAIHKEPPQLVLKPLDPRWGDGVTFIFLKARDFCCLCRKHYKAENSCCHSTQPCPSIVWSLGVFDLQVRLAVGEVAPLPPASQWQHQW